MFLPVVVNNMTVVAMTKTDGKKANDARQNLPVSTPTLGFYWYSQYFLANRRKQRCLLSFILATGTTDCKSSTKRSCPIKYGGLKPECGGTTKWAAPMTEYRKAPLPWRFPRLSIFWKTLIIGIRKTAPNNGSSRKRQERRALFSKAVLHST